MPPHRRSEQPKKSKGLLSHVFSFVSREFESFVLNATAGPASQPESDTRVKKRRAHDQERNLGEDKAKYKSRTRPHRERDSRSKREPFRPKPSSKSTDLSGKHSHTHFRHTHIDDNQVILTSDRERSNSPPPQPPPVFLEPQLPALRKKPSITMPGSLFPRSPSLVPDQQDMVHRAQVTLHVPVPARSLHHSHNGGLAQVSTVPSTSSEDPSALYPHSIASVKDAIERFKATDGAEANFSIMLPSPHSSPVKPVSKTVSIDEMSPHYRTSISVPLPLISSKGKERARYDTDNDDLEFIIGGSSGHDGVQAKERELDAALEEQRENEKRSSGDRSRRASDEYERDKRRIRTLEEEVRRLKDELSRSQVRSSPPPPAAPPPPPPPPPPPLLPLRIDTAPFTPTSMFATARASLRHAMTPVEVPINNPVLLRTKRKGQPTVNVPSEKMAAFLEEIKTAKLRRVGSGGNAMGGDGIAGPSGLSRSVIVTTGSASTGLTRLSAKELLRRRSLASLRVPIGSSLAAPVPPSALTASRGPEVRVGLKRKVDALGMDEVTNAPAKRHMTGSFLQSSSETSQNTATSSSEVLSLSDLPLPSRTNETDVTTPSLCSDNDRDENSIEDRVPSTPPGPRATSATQKFSNTNARKGHVDVIVDVEEHSHPEPRTISREPAPRRTSDMFKKRPPTSPIPFPTPRKPSAPARTKRGATPKPKTLPYSYSDEGAVFPQATSVPPISLIPILKPEPTKSKNKPSLVGKGRPRPGLHQQNGHTPTSSGSGSSSQNKRKRVHKRRQTLDEELRAAEGHSSDMDQCNDELDPEKEDDVFTATGTKSTRRGFLAHGGGGGAPVFMGVGYVQGAISESSDEDEVVGAQPVRSSKLATQISLIPRPKART